MKQMQIKRRLSLFLASLFLVLSLPLNAISIEAPETTVTAEGLPFGAEVTLETKSNPFVITRSTKKAKAATTMQVGPYKSTDFVAFYDIKATANNREIQPNGDVTVTIHNAAISSGQDVYVLHLLDSADAIRNAQSYFEINDRTFAAAFPIEAAAAEAVTGRTGIVCAEEFSVANGMLAINGTDLTFTTRSFSIYAIVETGDDARLTVNFVEKLLDGTVNTIKTMTITKAQAASVDTLIYDPGIGRAFNDGELFRGWTTKEDYTTEDSASAKTIEDVRDEVVTRLDELVNDAEEGGSSASSVTYYAMIYKAYTVTYRDESFVSIGSDVVLFKSGSSVSYQINTGYIPKTQDGEFQGWRLVPTENNVYESRITVNSVNTEEVTYTFQVNDGSNTFTVFTNQPTEVTLTGNIEFICYVPSGYWLSFNENGKGASYTPPKFYKSGVPTEFPAVPTRAGYTFGGWYTDPECTDGNEFSFGLPLTARTDLYAKWNPVDFAKYTVIIWKEKSTDTYANNSTKKNYDFDTAYVLRGQVGTTINAVSTDNTSSTSDINGTYSNYRVSGVRNADEVTINELVSYLGYHAAKYDTGKVITPEGSTIVNVYYDRHVVRYSFYYGTGGNAVYVEDDGPTGIYGLVDGDYVLLTQIDGQWTYPGTTQGYVAYTGSYDSTVDYYGLFDGRYERIYYVNGQWCQYTGEEGYYELNTTQSGTYLIPDGNGGYVEKALTYNNGVWTYVSDQSQWTQTNSNNTTTYGKIGNNGDDSDYVELVRSGNNYYYKVGSAANGISNDVTYDSSKTYYRQTNNGFSELSYGQHGAGILHENHTCWYYRQTGFYVDFTGDIYLRYSGTRYIKTPVTITYTGNPYAYGALTEAYEGTVYTLEYLPVEYTGEHRYRRDSGSNGWNTYDIQTGLYGEHLNWPTDLTIWWYPNGNQNGQVSGTRMTYKDDFLPLDEEMDVKYYGVGNQSGGSRIRFYTQDVTGGNNYTQQVEVSVSSGSWWGGSSTFSINDKFSGFQAYQYRSSSNNGSTWTNWQNVGTFNPQTGIYGSAVNVNDILEIRFRRLSNTITFMDGTYFDGNGNDALETNRGELYQTSEYFYQTDISSYNEGEDDYYEVTADASHRGYVFAGWYADSTCSVPYTFDTMTQTGVTVYAKWVIAQYRVYLHPNADNPSDDEHETAWHDPTFNFGQTNQAACFRIDYGTKISGGVTIMGERLLYELVGWYTDPACTQSFNFDAYVLNDTTVTTPYDWDEDETEIDKYGDVEPGQEGVNKDKNNNRFWITRKLDLYAKWRYKLIGADGIDIQFVSEYGSEHGTFDGGNTVFSDALQYTDNAVSYGTVASTATSSTEQFKYWVVQKWDPDQEIFVDVLSDANDATSVTRVYPGQEFTVLARYCRDVETDEFYFEDPNDPENNVKKHIYTFQLRAEYGPIESPETTTITYNANGGEFVTGTQTTYGFVDQGQAPLYVNETHTTLSASDLVEREGYTFMGWAFTSTAVTPVFEGGQKVAADNLNRDPGDPDNTEANTLYAVWYIDVTIQKIMNVGGAGDPWAEFEFPITFSVTGPDNNAFTDIKDKSGSSVTSPVSIKPNQSVIICVPQGSKVTASEVLTTANAGDQNRTIADVFDVTYDPETVTSAGVTVSEPVTIKVINTKKSGNLKIVKIVKEAADSETTLTTNENFLFKVERLKTEGSSVTVDAAFTALYVAIEGNGSVTVMELEAGNYRVTELTSWSWRYDVNDPEAGVDDVTVVSGETAEAPFTNVRNAMNWLHGENNADNVFGN